MAIILISTEFRSQLRQIFPMTSITRSTTITVWRTTTLKSSRSDITVHNPSAVFAYFRNCNTIYLKLCFSDLSPKKLIITYIKQNSKRSPWYREYPVTCETWTRQLFFWDKFNLVDFSTRMRSIPQIYPQSEYSVAHNCA